MSEQFFDLEKLHEQQRRQKYFWLIMGALLLVLTIAVTIKLSETKHPVQHLATVSYGTSNTPASTSHSSPSITSPDNSKLSQEEAQEQAQAAQDEADANKDVSSAQQEQNNLNSETPPSSSNLTPVSLPTISTSLPAPTCTYPGNLSSLMAAYTQAQGKLSSFEADPEAYVSTYGVDASGLQAEEKQEELQLETVATNAYNAYEAAEAQVQC